MSKRPESAWISRRKSTAANRPSPSAFGGVFEVAAMRVPPSASSPSSRVMIIVSPGSSSSNSSIATRLAPLSSRTVCGVAERADERRVLDEGAEVLAAGRERPERGEQVGLADAESAVEVEARLRLRSATTREETAARLPAAPRTPAPWRRPRPATGYAGSGTVVLEASLARTGGAEPAKRRSRRPTSWAPAR